MSRRVIIIPMTNEPNRVAVLVNSRVVFHERYRIVRCIGEGAMGVVYEVVDERTNSPRALKLMRSTLLAAPELRRRFTVEATVTGSIDSEHLVRISDAGVDEETGLPFLAMELLRGDELGAMIDRHGALPPGDVVTYLRQAALALDKTHLAGIVHRDLKPENLFVTYRDDGSPCVKILDFGIAKVAAQSAARSTSHIGTPLFMAPEQVHGEGPVGPRADLFALGHIAYALLAGEPYWNEELLALESVYQLLANIVRGIQEAPTARARRRSGIALPPAFDGWIRKSLASLPEDRFDRATAQIATLAEVLGMRPSFPSLASWGTACAPSLAGTRDTIAPRETDVSCTTALSVMPVCVRKDAPHPSYPDGGPQSRALSLREARVRRGGIALAASLLLAMCAAGSLALRSRGPMPAAFASAYSAGEAADLAVRSGEPTAAPLAAAATVSTSSIAPPPSAGGPSLTTGAAFPTASPIVGAAPTASPAVAPVTAVAAAWAPSRSEGELPDTPQKGFEDATASPNPAAVVAKGLLDIDSIPASYVLLDGRPLGRTPRLREPVPAGRHDLAFVYPLGVSCRQSIDVSPGASARAIDRLGAPSAAGRRCREIAADAR
jgi:serine/threonine-protein kinase